MANTGHRAPLDLDGRLIKIEQRIKAMEEAARRDLTRLPLVTNRVQNGDFTGSSAGWVLDAGVTYSSNAISFSTGSASVKAITSETLNWPPAGSRALVKVECTAYTSGAAVGNIGNLGGTAQTPDIEGTGVVSLAHSVTGAETFFDVRSKTSGFTGTIDNISLWEADPDDDAPWLRLTPGYDVRDSGLIVRDGTVLMPDDYTRIDRNGQVFIKPLTPPGVNTQFQIFAEAYRG